MGIIIDIMTQDSHAKSADRFTGLAALYAKYRPDYPVAAIDYIIRHSGLTPGVLLVDVGCGTGISSRLFASRGLQVVGIEPNRDMRLQAKAEANTGNTQEEGRVEYRDGQAEATGLDDASAAAVLAAQSFHWFEAGAALNEFSRILQPGGWVNLMWNERDARDPFTAAYGAILRSTPEGQQLESHRSGAGKVLLTAQPFRNAGCVEFEHAQNMDEDQMIGRALSISYAPKDKDAIGSFVDQLREVFARFQQDGRATLRYVTSIYSAQK